MKRKLFLLLCALLTMIGVTQVKAYTLSELTSAGWTKVTSISDVDNNYYVFVDAGSSNYAMGRLSYGTDRPVYQSLVDPLGFNGVVWYLGANGDNYTIRSIADDHFFISGTEGWNDQIADQQWGNEGLFTFTADLPTGKFSIQSVKTSSYVGPWNNDNKVALDNGYENIAANKAANQAPGFYLYSIPRAVYNANRITASWLTSHGWSQVTANSALGNTDNYYLIIEKETFGYAMARTSNGRPASKSLSNPFATKNELWLIAAKGSGYSLQNVVDGTYFTSAAGDWNTSMSNSPNADIIATVSEGVYTLSAGGTSSIGHWRNGKTFPYENESVAANKSDGDRNSYYIYTISKTDYATQRAAYLASLASSATSAAPVELTNFIFNNSDFATLAKLGWTVSGTWGNQQTSNGAYETWNSNNVSVTQELANMPGGKYKLTVQMVSGNDGRVPYLYANADKEYLANVTQQATTTTYDGMRDEIAANPNYGLLTVNPNVTNGTLTVGMKAPSGWVVFDNFKLSYYGPTLASSAVVLPNDGVMTAGQWYYFDIAVAGDNYNATATNLDDIICFSDGNTLVEEAISGDITLKATDNSFAVGRYYVKSSSDNNLVVAASSYEYNVSEATADKAYVQASQTVTVSYTVSTNDPAATLAQNYSGVTLDGVAINVTPGASGFTFTLPANLEAGVPHTLYIPAGAIGYEAGSTYNAEQNITLNAVAVYDGVYYMRNTYFNTYISRAGNYNTQAIQDKWGLAFKVSTDANNNTKLQYFDSELWLGDNGYCYGDCSGDRVRSFNVTKVANGYKFLNTNNNLYLAVYDGQTVGDAEEGGNLVGTSNVWDLESTEAHVANYTANDNAQAAAAATAAGIEGITTKAALAAELAANYEEVDINITGAKAEKYQVYPGDGKDSGPVIYYSETVENLKPGIYKLTVGAFQRAAGYDRVAAADGARSLIYLYAGDAKTQIKSVMEYGAAEAYTEGWNPDYEYKGMHYPNSQDAGYAALATGNFNNEVYVYVADAGSGTGSLEIGIKNPTRLGGDFATWSVYNTWKLTYYSEPFVAPTALTLNETALSFNADNYSATLTATPTPAEAAPEVTWSSSDNSVATVSAAGVVTGVSTGTATITATSLYDTDVKATCEVTVTFPDYTGYSKSYKKDGTTYYLADANIIKNGSFEYPNSVAFWTTGTGSVNPMSTSNFNIPTEGAAVGTHYLQAKESAGGSDARSINTSWALENGKSYVFGYKIKANKECTTDLQYIGTSLSNTKGSENAGKKFETPAYGTEWKDVTYYFENTENFKYLVFNARWLASAQSFDGFYLAEVVGQESATGDTKTVTGEVTEDYTVIPSGDYPIVDISGATFDGTLTVDYSSNANGFVIATADQKTTLGDVKNVVVGSTCANLVLTDGFSATIPAALTSATAASYERNVANTNVYGTICLPFNMESNSYIQFYTVEEVDGTENVLKLETADAVEAGVPAIYKNLTANAIKIEVATNNATVVVAAGTQGTDPKLVGTFTGETVSGANVDKCYYIKGNQFWQGNTSFSIPAYRAYIQTDVNAGARLTIRTDDDPTAINELKKLDEQQGLKDGKYLINGKVIVVKAGKQFYINGALNK